MASGLSRRFGRNKLLHMIDGTSLIQRVFQAVPAGLFVRAVVVSRYLDLLDLAKMQGYQPIFNPHGDEGQCASLRLGLSCMSELDEVLFAVCDQPWLRRKSVTRLLADFYTHPNGICALSWRGQRGNPVVFPTALFPELLALTGDRGGSGVIQTHPELLRTVEAESARELWDVDTPDDLCCPPSGPF